MRKYLLFYLFVGERIEQVRQEVRSSLVVQGAVDELRHELRAFACHLSAQQMGALAHLTAAQHNTGGAQNAVALNWSPAMWGRQAAPGALARRPRTLPNSSGRFETSAPDALVPVASDGGPAGAQLRGAPFPSSKGRGAAASLGATAAATVHWGGAHSFAGTDRTGHGGFFNHDGVTILPPAWTKAATASGSCVLAHPPKAATGSGSAQLDERWGRNSSWIQPEFGSPALGPTGGAAGRHWISAPPPAKAAAQPRMHAGQDKSDLQNQQQSQQGGAVVLREVAEGLRHVAGHGHGKLAHLRPRERGTSRQRAVTSYRHHRAHDTMVGYPPPHFSPSVLFVSCKRTSHRAVR